MNLRGRSIKPEMEGTKKRNVRRSVRSKTKRVVDNSLTTIRSQRKRRYSKNSQKKTVKSQPYFPPVEEIGISEVTEELATLPAESSSSEDFFYGFEVKSAEPSHKNRSPFWHSKMTDGEHDEVHSALASAEVPRSGPPQADMELSGQGRSSLLPKAEATKTENFTKKMESSCEEGSVLPVPVAARTLGRIDPNLINIPSENIKTQINCFEINSAMEELNTNLPTSMHESKLPNESACLGSSHIELMESSSSEDFFYGFDVKSAETSHENRSPFWHSKGLSRGITCTVKREESFADDESECASTSYRKKKPYSRKLMQKSNNTSSQKYPKFSIVGDVINMKIEQDSFSDDNCNYTSRLQVRRTSSRLGLRESKHIIQ